MKRANIRPQNTLRRILTLIEALSSKRMPFTLQEAVHLLEEKSGSRVNVSMRTVERDMKLLVAANVAHVYRKGVMGSRGAGSSPTQYKMDMRLTRLPIDL